MINKIMKEYGVSAGKRDQIEIFFKKKFLSKIDVDLIIWSRTFIISKKNFLLIWSVFPALTPTIKGFMSKVTINSDHIFCRLKSFTKLDIIKISNINSIFCNNKRWGKFTAKYIHF